jgi:hypothetical protein
LRVATASTRPFATASKTMWSSASLSLGPQEMRLDGFGDPSKRRARFRLRLPLFQRLRGAPAALEPTSYSINKATVTTIVNQPHDFCS